MLKDNERDLCEENISGQEIEDGMKNLKDNKSPGLVGVTPEF